MRPLGPVTAVLPALRWSVCGSFLLPGEPHPLMAGHKLTQHFPACKAPWLGRAPPRSPPGCLCQKQSTQPQGPTRGRRTGGTRLPSSSARFTAIPVSQGGRGRSLSRSGCQGRVRVRCQVRVIMTVSPPLPRAGDRLPAQGRRWPHRHSGIWNFAAGRE